jgi:hypothetical protein
MFKDIDYKQTGVYVLFKLGVICGEKKLENNFFGVAKRAQNDQVMKFAKIIYLLQNLMSCVWKNICSSTVSPKCCL